MAEMKTSYFESEKCKVVFDGKVYSVSQEVQLFLEKGQKIQAIKQLRTEYSLGLREAKNLAEFIDTEYEFSGKHLLPKQLEELNKKKSKDSYDYMFYLRNGLQQLIDKLSRMEQRIEALEKIDAKLTFVPVEECKRLIEMQSDRLTAQSHRIDSLAKEILELKRELEKRPKRRMIVRRKESE